MTETETKKIIASMMATYPNYTPNNINLTISVWTDLFTEYSYQQVSAGLKAYMQSDTSGFAPSPGQVIDLIHKVSGPQFLNEQEAWSLVSKAIKNSGYNSETEFSKLPKIVQKAVGSPQQLKCWALDEDYNEGVEKASFQRTYRMETEKEHEFLKMPSAVRDMIEGNRQKQLREQIPQAKSTETVLIPEKETGAIPENLRSKIDEIKGAQW